MYTTEHQAAQSCKHLVLHFYYMAWIPQIKRDRNDNSRNPLLKLGENMMAGNYSENTYFNTFYTVAIELGQEIALMAGGW